MDRPPPWPLVNLTQVTDRPVPDEAPMCARVGLDGNPAAEIGVREVVQRHLERLIERADRVPVDSIASGTWEDETGRFAWAAALTRRTA